MNVYSSTSPLFYSVHKILSPKTTYTSEIVCPLPFQRSVSYFRKHSYFSTKQQILILNGIYGNLKFLLRCHFWDKLHKIHEWTKKVICTYEKYLSILLIKEHLKKTLCLLPQSILFYLLLLLLFQWLALLSIAHSLTQ